jgi:hypothetical protein
MMPPGVVGPGVREKVKKEVKEGQKEEVKRIVETEKKNPFHALDSLENTLGLKARSEDYKPRYRAKEKISGDGGDDDDEGADDEKPI